MIVVYGPPNFDARRVASALEPLAPCLALPLYAREAENSPDLARAAVVLPGQNLVGNGEIVSRLRASLPAEIPLLVCCPQVSATDRQLLLDCGATTVITPRAWDPALVAERILGELILNQEIEPSALGALRGATVSMQSVYRQIETLAPLREPVLILGETGCGKDLVARELHRRSKRSGDLMSINCAALTPELLESELFGHERGAFTGAMERRRGLLVEAGRGTVFLDEIGDLTLSAQAKLLRTLEESKVRPVGSNVWSSIEARLIFATHRDLGKACLEKSFRQDLYERLRGFTINVPPLRERRADLPLLVQHFVDEYNHDYPGTRTVPPGVVDTLFRYSWPGNVRELRMAVRQAAAYTGNDRGSISALHLLDVAQRAPMDTHPHTFSFDPASESWAAVQDRLRVKYFRAIVAQAGGHKEAAARIAGVSRSQFYEIWKQIEASRHQDE